MHIPCCIVITVLFLAEVSSTKQPNIVFVLTDDQDVQLNGEIPIEKTRRLIGDAGIKFDNMFVTSPLCCPSRSSILTGYYVHNHGALNNSVTGNCSSPDWQQNRERKAFAPYLKQQGYNTFFAGKYLNQYGIKLTGGPAHVPPGWDWWIGLVGNSKYYNYKLSVNGTGKKHGNDYRKDYLTDNINRYAERFLNLQPSGDSDERDRRPFFMMLSTPACHSPFTPAPQYSHAFSNMSAPRTPSFNRHAKDKHWLMRQAKTPMSKDSLQYIDTAFKNRWRTLLSVDDMVENVVKILERKQLLNNTYIFFTGDNGFHLGQFSLPNDKRQAYEFDLRVPLMVRGPGIKPGQIRQEPILNIDFAPTFIDIAGQTPPEAMDGESFKQILTREPHTKPQSWRTTFLAEHWGEQSLTNPGCPQYDNQQMSNCYPDCVCEDSLNNTYSCLRIINRLNKQSVNMKYCSFNDNQGFMEAYDLDSDPAELTNIYSDLSSKVITELNKMLTQLKTCSGPSCKTVTSNLVSVK